MKKPWYKSKTVWLNVGSITATVVGAISQILPNLQGLLSIESYLVMSGLVGAANIVLRTYFTSTAIK